MRTYEETTEEHSRDSHSLYLDRERVEPLSYSSWRDDDD